MKSRVLAGLMLLAIASSAEAQEPDQNFRWYLGAQGGMVGFATRTQARSWIPSVGGSLLIVSKRTGLLITADEALGKGELTGYTDVTQASQVRPVSFDRIRRYSAVLTGYPVRGATRPYFGIGYNLTQVLKPQVGGFFTSPTQASQADGLASNKSTTGHALLLAGVEAAVGRAVIFGQYQLASAPTENQLIKGSIHGFQGGVRFSLGSAREGIRGGGY